MRLSLLPSSKSATFWMEVASVRDDRMGPEEQAMLTQDVNRKEHSTCCLVYVPYFMKQSSGLLLWDAAL